MLKSSKGLKRAIVIPVPTPIDTVKLGAAMEKLEFRECGKTTEESWGFIKAGDSDQWPILAKCQNYYILTVRYDRRVPNKSRLSREWQAAIKEKEKTENRKLTKDERDRLRDEVKVKLFAVTAPDEHTYQAIYDADNRILVVTESNGNAAEFFVEKINVALKDQGQSIGWKFNALDAVLESTLTSWVYKPDSLPKVHNFEVGTNMSLHNESCKATLVNQEANTEEVRIHLHNAKQVQQIQLTWKDEISFVLSSKKILSQMNFKTYCGEKIKEVQADGNTEDLRSYQQATFLVYYTAFLELWNAVEAIPTEL